MPILQAKGLKKYYGKEPNLVYALNGVDVAVEQGEFVAVVGMSAGLTSPQPGKSSSMGITLRTCRTSSSPSFADAMWDLCFRTTISSRF